MALYSLDIALIFLYNLAKSHRGKFEHMAKINSNYKKLQAGYLFPEISRRVKEFQHDNPKANLIKLGIGDTTLPLSKTVIKSLHEAVDKMANAKTYSGYGTSEVILSCAKHWPDTTGVTAYRWNRMNFL